jgi:hypothetical protein
LKLRLNWSSRQGTTSRMKFLTDSLVILSLLRKGKESRVILASLALNLSFVMSFLRILLKALQILLSSGVFYGSTSSIPILLLSFFTNSMSFSSFCSTSCSDFSLPSASSSFLQLRLITQSIMRTRNDSSFNSNLSNKESSISVRRSWLISSSILVVLAFAVGFYITFSMVLMIARRLEWAVNSLEKL